MKISTIRLTPPEPIVTPADIPGSHAPDDAAVKAMIAAATEQIDGPNGTVGRAFGPQMLEARMPEFPWRRPLRLLCPPIISIESVTYLDTDGVAQTFDPASYRLAADEFAIVSGTSLPSLYCAADAVRIRYKAGYNGSTGAEEGEVQTGPVPELARLVIIMSVADIMRLASQERSVRSETVEGIGSTTYVDDDKITAAARSRAEHMLSGLWVPSI